MRKFLKVFAYVLGALFALSLIGGALLYHSITKQLKDGGKVVEWSDDYGSIYRDLRYGEGSRHTYNLIIPTEKKPTSLMLFIHGGAWSGGDKKDIEYEAYRYARQGYATAVINYTRIRSDSLDYPSGYNSPSIVSMLDEITLAIEALKIKGEELGCHFNNLALGGYSAGGHLAMLYATQRAEESAIPVRFVISWVGPSDFNTLFPTDYDAIESAAINKTQEDIKMLEQAQMFVQFLDGFAPSLDDLTRDNIEEYKRKASPLYHISSSTPPMVLAYGAEDNLVNKLHGEKMASALKSCGVENHLIIFPNSGHGLSKDPEFTKQVNDIITSLCERFFE